MPSLSAKIRHGIHYLQLESNLDGIQTEFIQNLVNYVYLRHFMILSIHSPWWLVLQSLWCKAEEGYWDVSRSGQILVERNAGTWASLPDLNLLNFRMSLSLGYLNQKYLRMWSWSQLQERLIILKNFFCFLFLMVQVLVAQGDFRPQITIHM